MSVLQERQRPRSVGSPWQVAQPQTGDVLRIGLVKLMKAVLTGCRTALNPVAAHGRLLSPTPHLAALCRCRNPAHRPRRGLQGTAQRQIIRARLLTSFTRAWNMTACKDTCVRTMSPCSWARR